MSMVNRIRRTTGLWLVFAVLPSLARLDFSLDRVFPAGFVVRFESARADSAIFSFSSRSDAFPSVSIRGEGGPSTARALFTLAGHQGTEFLQWMLVSCTQADSGFITLTFDREVYAPQAAQNARMANGKLTIPTSSSLAKATSADLPRHPVTEGIRIEVNHDGIYRIDASELSSLGVDISAISARLYTLHEQGREIPLFLSALPDQSLSGKDYILFYGSRLKGSSSHHAQFSDRNVYWLTWKTGRPGLRMAAASGAIRIDEVRYREDLTGVPLHAREFPDTLHVEEDRAIAFLGNIDQVHETGSLDRESSFVDNWYWGTIGERELTDFQVSIPSPSVAQAGESSRARLTVCLRGLTDAPGVTDDHVVHLLINGNTPLPSLLPAVWSGQEETIYRTPFFDVSALAHGANTLTFRTPQNRGFADRSTLNWIKVEYYRDFWALNDQFRFSPHRADMGHLKQFTIRGFSVPTIDVWDIAGARIIQGYQVRRPTGMQQSHTMVFQDSLSAASSFLVQTVSLRKKPLLLARDTIRPDRLPNVAPDYLMISTRKLVPLLAPLASVHRNRGLSVELVALEDIYNVFASGIRDPGSIKAFLSYLTARSAGNPPRFLLLAGDATHDLDKLNATRSQTIVPTHLSRVPQWGPCSDDGYFASVVGTDPIPDLCVGRFPVRDSTDLKIMVAKTVAYLQNPHLGPWRDNALILGGFDKEFSMFNDRLVEETIGPRTQVLRMDAHPQSPFYHSEAIATRRIADQINTGVYFINFNGHGGGNIWSDSRFFSYTDITQLYNHTWAGGGYLPFVFSLTCLTGFFESTTYRSLGEEFVRTGPQGAIGFYGASAYTTRSGNLILNRILLDHALNGNFSTIGELLLRAETDVLAFDPHRYLPLIQQYNFLGDPALPWHLAPDTLRVALNRSNLSDRDSLSISVNNIPFNQGFIRLSAGPDPATRWSNTTQTLSQSSWGTRLDIKDSAVVSRGLVRAYAWNGSRHVRGWAEFSRNSIRVHDVKAHPQRPHFGDSIVISCYLPLPETMENPAVYCMYTVDDPHTAQPDFSRFPGIPLVRDTLPNRWISAAPIVVPYTGHYPAELLIKFRVSGLVGESSRFAFPINGLPDVQFAKPECRIHWRDDSLAASFTVINAGNEPSPEFSISFRWEGFDSAFDSTISAPLAPGAVRTFTRALPDTQGSIGVEILLNTPTRFRELNRENNRISATTTVRYADLHTPSDTLFSTGRGVAVYPLSQISQPRRSFLFSSPLRENGPFSRSRWMQVGEDSTALWQLGTRPSLGSDSLVWQFNRAHPSLSRQTTVSGEVEAVLTRSSLGSGWTLIARSDAGQLRNVTSSAGPFAAAVLTDKTPPSIRLSVDGRPVGFLDYSAKDKPFDAFIEDLSGIVHSSVRVKLNGKALDSSAFSAIPTTGGQSLMRLTIHPPRGTGIDSLAISAADQAGNDTTAVFTYLPGKDLSIKFLTCHPNPFTAAQSGTGMTRQTIRLAYLLTDVADEVKLSIFTMSGRPIRSWHFRNVIGYQEVAWDGKNESGFRIANGTYYLKVVARKDKKTVTRNLTIAKLEGF